MKLTAALQSFTNTVKYYYWINIYECSLLIWDESFLFNRSSPNLYKKKALIVKSAPQVFIIKNLY